MTDAPSKIADTLFSGVDMRIESVPCSECGEMTDWPVGIAKRMSGDQPPPPICDKCAERHKAELEAEIRERDELERKKLYWKLSNAPDGLKRSPLLPASLELIERERRGLLLYGPIGARKTTQAVEIVRQWCWNGRRVYYCTEAEMMDDLRNWDEHHDHLRMLKTISLLVIDEAGRSKASEWVAQTFSDLIDARYRNANLHTVIVANHSLEELAKINEDRNSELGGKNPYDPRVVRRLQEMCGKAVKMEKVVE